MIWSMYLQFTRGYHEKILNDNSAETEQHRQWNFSVGAYEGICNIRDTTQALVAGVYPEEETPVPDRVTFYPVYFEQGKLNFPIVGMSDEMPYPSTRYRDMTPRDGSGIQRQFFDNSSDEAVRDLNPDLILCHHLYLFDCHRTGTFSRPEGLWILP